MNEDYLLLDDVIYSPAEIEVPFGSVVNIDKRDKDEIWFHLKENPDIKGYVVYPCLFAEATEENKLNLEAYKSYLRQMQELSKLADIEMNNIKLLK